MYRVLCQWVVVLVGWPGVVWADVLPAGHKSVTHELVFEGSELLNANRLVAAPIAGFHGVATIKSGERFSFSSKYGTKLYLVPKEESLPTDFDRDRFSKWPHCPPPVHEISSVPWTSPVASALTVLKLDSISEAGPVISVVSHAENDSMGNPASTRPRWLMVGAMVVVGLGLCLAARRWFWRIYLARGVDRLSAPDLVDRHAG